MISILFEIVICRAVVKYANREGLQLKEPLKGYHYPDFTLMHNHVDKFKIAIDLKTTNLD